LFASREYGWWYLERWRSASSGEPVKDVPDTDYERRGDRDEPGAQR
jgi:hypothetical protein